MTDLSKFIIVKIISITIVVSIINFLFIFIYSEVFSSFYFTCTILFLNLFVIIDKIFQPLILIGREKKDFKQAFFLILFLFANPFIFAFPYLEYNYIAKNYYQPAILNFFWFLGLLLLIIGGITMCAGRITLGRYAFLIITIETTQKLVKKGPYAYIRHPIYTGVLFLFLGYIISFSSIIGLIIIIPFFIFWGRKRMNLEEKQLINTFGDEYREYMTKTKRLIPMIY